jgi:hypothetical protein
VFGKRFKLSTFRSKANTEIMNLFGEVNAGARALGFGEELSVFLV